MNEMIEMTVDSLHTRMTDYQNVVILKGDDTNLILAIWLGIAQTEALRIAIQDEEPFNPIVYDLMCTIIDKYGGKVLAVMIHDIRKDMLYAKVRLASDNEQFVIDSGPGDAVNLAVRTGAPILVSEDVLNQVGIDLPPNN